MNKKLGLAVAGALLAASASAQAGITIPAGDWTLDIGGNVNAYYTTTKFTGDLKGEGNNGFDRTNNITTGLLPNFLAVSGKSRQNDLDIAFTISINPGSSTTSAADQNPKQENRQAFMTIGDASWGSVKLGKDLGVFASDAILSDMTLLGVGSNAGASAGGPTTLGRIGTGYIYADWKAQVAYTTPNWNGFQATVAATQAFDGSSYNYVAAGDAAQVGYFLAGRKNSAPAFEAKASYAWTGDVAGKVWVSGITQQFDAVDSEGVSDTKRGSAYDIGANVNAGGFGLTGYYYDGKGSGTTGWLMGAVDASGKRTDSKGGYVQATYVIPTGTKLGASWGQSKLDVSSAEGERKNSSWIIGAYHPLTKSVNLVAEYNDQRIKHEGSDTAADNGSGHAKTVSLGAILFF